jgi:phage terminase small subunit
MTLTPKQKRFVSEYLLDLNATKAAVRAGYSEKTAEQQGYRLLRNVQVAEAVQKAVEERAERKSLSADYVIDGIVETIERLSAAGKRGRFSTARVSRYSSKLLAASRPQPMYLSPSQRSRDMSFWVST